MLSGPPPSLARSTSSRQHASGLPHRPSTRPIPSSSRTAVSPSVQSRSRSPFRRGTRRSSGSERVPAPSVRVTTFRAGMVLRLGQRDPSRRHELGGHVVVNGEPPDPAVAEKVGPAVPDVGDRPSPAGPDGEHDRRAHPGEPGVGRARSPYGGVGPGDGGPDAGLEGFVPGERVERGHERFGRDPARHLSAGETAEAVRDHVDLPRRVGADRVLVRSPHPPPVRQPCGRGGPRVHGR